MSTTLVPLELDAHLWERVFTAAPLVLVGSREADGSHDLAPKHMATPLGFAGHYGFVCTPRHATWRNVVRSRVFTVSWPRPEQILLTSLGAAPRAPTGQKSSLVALPTRPATVVDGVLLEGAVLSIECELERTIEGFGDHGLIVGQVVAAHAAADAVRAMDSDEADLLHACPALVYLHPTRFAVVKETLAFPFPVGFSR